MLLLLLISSRYTLLKYSELKFWTELPQKKKEEEALNKNIEKNQSSSPQECYEV